MKTKMNFADTTPAGVYAPFLPAGFGLAKIIKVEDAKPKEGKQNPESFIVTLGHHEESARYNSEAKPGQEARQYVQYDEKNGFTMGFFMAAFDMAEADIRNPPAGSLMARCEDPAAPDSPLIGRPIWYEAKIGTRVDKTDPTKKYNEVFIYTKKQWDEAREKAAKTVGTNGAGHTAAASGSTSTGVSGLPGLS